MMLRKIIRVKRKRFARLKIKYIVTPKMSDAMLKAFFKDSQHCRRIYRKINHRRRFKKRKFLRLSLQISKNKKNFLHWHK